MWTGTVEMCRRIAEHKTAKIDATKTTWTNNVRSIVFHLYGNAVEIEQNANYTMAKAVLYAQINRNRATVSTLSELK